MNLDPTSEVCLIRFNMEQLEARLERERQRNAGSDELSCRTPSAFARVGAYLANIGRRVTARSNREDSLAA